MHTFHYDCADVDYPLNGCEIFLNDRDSCFSCLYF